MKALVLKGAMDFSYEEQPEPASPPGHVLVRVEAVCICGSDIHAIQGRQPLFSFPRVIGHEVAGVVHQVGAGVSQFRPGDRVCLMPCIPCGTCRACRAGRTNACGSLELYGVQTDGGLREYMAAPESNWLKMPEGAAPEEIAVLEPLTIGAHAVAKLGLQPDHRVLVVGAGPIGVSCALNAQTYGVQVTLADNNAVRREFAAERFGLAVLDPNQEDYPSQIHQATQGELFDAVVDTTAAKQAMESDWKWICQGGKIVFVGICNGALELDGVSFHMREPFLFVTRNSTRRDFERVLRFWQLGMLQPERFLTHKVSFFQAGESLPRWTDPAAGVFKGVVLFQQHKAK